MDYVISHSTKYTYSESVPVCHNQVHLAPRETPQQQLQYHSLVIHPEPQSRGRRTDYFGNLVDYFSLHEAHFGMTVTSKSQLRLTPPPSWEASPAWEEVVELLATNRNPQSLKAYQCAFASPYVPSKWPHREKLPSYEQLQAYARESFPARRPILEATRDLTSRIHKDFSFDPKATTLSTPVQEVFHRRRGVCQDFAHLQLACLRSLGLAARYVSGYLRTEPPPGQPRLVGADASHAWIAVYIGDGSWIDFDPTNDVVPSTDHITVSWGRDYGDVCPIQGVFVGGGQHTMQVSVDVTTPDDAD